MWINRNLPGSRERQLGRRFEDGYSVTLPPISKRYMSMLYCQGFNKFIDENFFQIQRPDLLVHKNTQYVFVKLCNCKCYD